MTTETLPANLATFTAAALYDELSIRDVVEQIQETARSIVPDIDSPSGRDEIKSLAYKIARSKTTLDNIGKEHVAEIKAKAKAIDNLRAEMRDDLDALKHEIRAPLDEWEAEQQRIDTERRERLARIESPAWPEDPVLIRGQVEAFKMSELTEEDFGPYLERARGSLVHAVRVGEDLIREAEEREERERQAEKDRAELEELRRKTEALEAEKRQRESAEQAKKDKAEAAKRKREEAKERKEREARIAREAAEAATRAAEAAAKRAEDERIAREAKAAEIERQRAEDAANVERVDSEIAEAFSLVIGRLREKNDPFVVTSEALAKTILEAIKSGEVPHVSIEY